MLHLDYAIRFKKIIIKTYKEIEYFFCGKKNINKQKIADRIQQQIDKIIYNETEDNVKRRKTENKKETIENKEEKCLTVKNKLVIKKEIEDKEILNNTEENKLKKNEIIENNELEKYLTVKNQENSELEINKENNKEIIENSELEKYLTVKKEEINNKEKHLTVKKEEINNKEKHLTVKKEEINNKEKIKKPRKPRIPKNPPKKLKKPKRKEEIEMKEIENKDTIKIEIKQLNEKKGGRRILGSNPQIQRVENIKNKINEEKENLEIENIEKIKEEINIKQERENIEKLLEKRNLKTKINTEDKIKENNSIVELFNSLKKDYSQKKTNEPKIEKKISNTYTLSDIYKRTINKQIQNKFTKPTKVDYNSYIPKTDIPLIDSDDQERMVPSFLKPEWTKGSVLQELLKKQTHEQLENFYKTEDVDITLIFPYVSDITNYSPNKIKYRKYTYRQI